MARRPGRPASVVVGPTVADIGRENVTSGDSGDGNSGGLIIDPGDIPDPDNLGTVGGSGGSSGSDAGSAVPKRRGRKPGSTNKGKGAALDLAGLTNIIAGFHTLLAAVTRAEELAIDEEEAAALAKASANVARHYNVEVAAKTTDWINLAIVAGGVYAPRVMAIRMRMGSERPARRNRTAQEPNPPMPERQTVVASEAPDLGPVDAFGFPVMEAYN